jgi:ribonuclease VapC
MFIDASALAAILLGESDGPEFSRAIDDADATTCVTSPIAVFEAALAVNRSQSGGIERAASVVLNLLRRAGVAILPVDEVAGGLAISAQARFGKGTGHPARLNLGDCFAYAMAKQHGVSLLYKGADFAQTDLA